MSLGLTDPVRAVPGVGRGAARRLTARFDISEVRDLLEHYPRRYHDLGQLLPLDLARIDEPVTILGTVVGWNHRRTRSRRSGQRLVISQAAVRDRNGSRFTVTFFNQRWREKRLPRGTVAGFSGTLERRYGRLQVTMPRVEPLGRTDGDVPDIDHRRLMPVYPAAEGLPSWQLAEFIEAALDRLAPVDDYLPAVLRRRFDLPDLEEALRGIHLPEDRTVAARSRRRLAFDELFTLQVGLAWRRVRLEAGAVGSDNGPVTGARAAARFLQTLPFDLTGAQRRAMDEIGVDLAAPRPMHRLLQGDVGSGKTLVATWALLCAVDHGRQGALMAPTEVLADQHYRTLTEQLAPLGVNVLDGVRVEQLTAATPVTARRRILAELAADRVDVVVGTHALLEEGVRFSDLGVVVIDEQHRFGVHQRVALKDKAAAGGSGRSAEPKGEDRSAPDVLVMTATPIPRSLALTLFGDLDVSVLDELPPGRQEVVTEVITPRQGRRRDRLYEFVRRQAAAGYQTYVVCALVDESEAIQARAAETEHARLRDQVFPDLRVGLVHGRMRPDDKEAAMAAFRRGELDVLVATTVIEVGIDVPTATVIVVEDADRYGISQLHQLRGRVGRGQARSYCVLFAGWHGEELTEEARQRLEAVGATTDGFALAETDLRLRGAGELFGVRQSGLPDLKVADLIKDRTLVVDTRDAAREMVAADPQLSNPELAALRAEVRRRYRGGLEELEALATG